MEISFLSVSVLGCRFIERDFCRIEFPRKSETKMLLSVLSGKLPWSVCSHHYIRLGKTTLPRPLHFNVRRKKIERGGETINAPVLLSLQSVIHIITYQLILSTKKFFERTILEMTLMMVTIHIDHQFCWWRPSVRDSDMTLSCVLELLKGLGDSLANLTRVNIL